MSKFPIINVREMLGFLKYSGFLEIRQKGSHKFFKHSDGRTATVPYHKGEDLGRGITRKILNDIDSSQEEFLKWFLE